MTVTVTLAKRGKIASVEQSAFTVLWVLLPTASEFAVVLHTELKIMDFK